MSPTVLSTVPYAWQVLDKYSIFHPVAKVILLDINQLSLPSSQPVSGFLPQLEYITRSPRSAPWSSLPPFMPLTHLAPEKHQTCPLLGTFCMAASLHFLRSLVTCPLLTNLSQPSYLKQHPSQSSYSLFSSQYCQACIYLSSD